MDFGDFGNWISVSRLSVVFCGCGRRKMMGVELVDHLPIVGVDGNRLLEI